MRNFEIKKISLISAFKVTIYLMIIPLLLFFLIGIGLLIGGAISRTTELILVGGAYSIMPVFMLIMYGVFSMLAALIYNWLAGKFGGLELSVVDKDEKISVSTNEFFEDKQSNQ
jgi:ABC-type dipeptide/oligopeptide/nickel transport system permease component